MTEFALYFDDGGHPDDQPYVLAAGFVSTEARWLEFEPVWLASLKTHNLGTVFHMTDFERRFKKNRKRGRILEELTGIISAHTTATFSFIINMDAYREVNRIYPLQEGLGAPWALAARALAKGINNWKKLHFTKSDRLLTLVEQGTKHRGDMEEVFNKDDIPIPLPLPKSTPQLQPADMLAWEVFHYAKCRDDRKSLVNLITTNELFEGRFDKKNLIKTCQNAGLPLRSEISSSVEIVYHSSPKRVRKPTIR